MIYLFPVGRFFFTMALLGFSAIIFLNGDFPAEFYSPSHHIQGTTVLAWIMGIIFLTTAIALLTDRYSFTATLICSIMMGLLLVIPNSFKLIFNIYSPGTWVAWLESLCFCTITIVISSLSTVNKILATTKQNRFCKIVSLARHLFAIALIIFGIQHIIYAEFIATLVPSWIPLKTFFLQLVKAGFILTGLSIIFNIRSQVALTLLGTMFLVWILILHAPLVFKNPHNKAEWTSFFVALLMCGACFILTSRSCNEPA